MPDRPVELDEHRGMAAQKSTELRRCLHELQADQTALQRAKTNSRAMPSLRHRRLGPRPPQRRDI